MSDRFRSKVQEFTSGVQSDHQEKDAKEIEVSSLAKNDSGILFHDKTQTCEKGRKQIDPETGLVYFKYDFGYEFGILGAGAVGETSGSISGSGSEKRKSMFDEMTGDLKPTVGSEVRKFKSRFEKLFRHK